MRLCVSASLCVVLLVDFGLGGGQVNGELRFSLCAGVCVCVYEVRFSTCSLFCVWACVYEVRFSRCVRVCVCVGV